MILTVDCVRKLSTVKSMCVLAETKFDPPRLCSGLWHCLRLQCLTALKPAV